jgi:hypothetical protein
VHCNSVGEPIIISITICSLFSNIHLTVSFKIHVNPSFFENIDSGIIHGPLTSPCSPTSVTFFCRPVAVGEVVVQLSLDRNFVEATTTRLSSNGPSDPLKAVLNDLQPASKYFCRCHLELPGEVDQTGVEVSYASCQFWTLLDIPSSNTDNEVPHQEVEVVAINGHYRQLRKDCGASCMSISDDESVRPMFSVVLGDIFDATSSQSTDAQLWQLFRQDPIFAAFCNEKDRNSMLTMSSMLCAWNDSQKGSDTGLKAEEIVHKQWSYDTRKYEKRQKEKLEKEKKEAFEQKAGGPSPSRKRSVAPPPALNRPAMSLAFSKLAKVCRLFNYNITLCSCSVMSMLRHRNFHFNTLRIMCVTCIVVSL